MAEQWKPSCGTEMMTMMCLCDRCERDRAAWPVDQGGQDRPENGCEIVALMGMNGEHPAWVIGADGRPTCTQFVEEGKEIPFVDTETLPLFDAE